MNEFTGKIIEIQSINNLIKYFRIETENKIHYLPGQYMEISLPNYSPSPMAIAGQINNSLEFAIRKWGKLTEQLFTLNVGDEIFLNGPYGTAFPIERISSDTKLYVIAGGTGITPARSLIKFMNSRGDKELFYGAKDTSELLFKHEYDVWDAKIYLTIDNEDSKWDGNIGFVSELISQHSLDNLAICFVCGPRPMMKAVCDILKSKGFSDHNIYVSLEKFDKNGKVVGPVLPLNDPEVDL